MKLQDFRETLVYGSIWATAMSVSYLLHVNHKSYKPDGWLNGTEQLGMMLGYFGVLASPIIVSIFFIDCIDAQG